MSGPKREVTGGWSRRNAEKFHDRHFSADIVKVTRSGLMRWAGHTAHVGTNINAHRVFVRKPEEMRPFGKYKRRCDDIKIEKGYKGDYSSGSG
jgi:hypothetical protein